MGLKCRIWLNSYSLYNNSIETSVVHSVFNLPFLLYAITYILGRYLSEKGGETSKKSSNFKKGNIGMANMQRRQDRDGSLS